MLLEWIRGQDGAFEKELRDYLFSEKSIVGTEKEKTGS